MTAAWGRSAAAWLAGNATLNFWLTNRIPRKSLTWIVGRLSKVEHPVVRDLCLAAWQAFADLDLSDARSRDFRSMHDCFTRQLREGARPPDPRPAVLASPSDGIVGGCGTIDRQTLLQAKGSTYGLVDLLAGDGELADSLEGGAYVTLRLTSAMYHRFHSPHDCQVSRITYVAGDAFNVNPATLARIPRLFCRNERAIVRCRLDRGGETIALVPVAAILVASIRLRFLDVTLHLRYRGPNEISCDSRLAKGEEMGWFEHGSTIIVLAPAPFRLAEGIQPGRQVRAGQGLLLRA
jgi:phosphatidylserine decarboxylase